MESQLRALLYNQLKNRTVAFNPVEPEPFDLVDLTRDVTNSTRIYHTRTECVREALAGVNLIITDSQPLANAVQRVLPRATVAALPFGRLNPHSGAGDEGGTLRVKEENIHPSSPILQPLTVGLLNHDGAMEMNNHYALKLLKSLKRELLVYGQALAGPARRRRRAGFCPILRALRHPALTQPAGSDQLDYPTSGPDGNRRCAAVP